MNAPLSGSILAHISAHRILCGEYPRDDGCFETDDWEAAAHRAVKGDVTGLVTMLAQAKAYGVFLDWQGAEESRWTEDFGDWFAARKHEDWQPFVMRWWKPDRKDAA